MAMPGVPPAAVDAPPGVGHPATAADPFASLNVAQRQAVGGAAGLAGDDAPGEAAIAGGVAARVEIDPIDERGVDHRGAEAEVEEQGQADAVEEVADVELDYAQARASYFVIPLPPHGLRAMSSESPSSRKATLVSSTFDTVVPPGGSTSTETMRFKPPLVAKRERTFV